MKSIELPILFYKEESNTVLRDLGIENDEDLEDRKMSFYKINALRKYEENKTIIYCNNDEYVCNMNILEIKDIISREWQ